MRTGLSEARRVTLGAANQLLGMGPKLVLLTHGQIGASVITRDGVSRIEAPPTKVVDTIGAGDAFGGGWLAFWIARGLTRGDLARADLAVEAARYATRVAALTCERRGAQPPTAAQLKSLGG